MWKAFFYSLYQFFSLLPRVPTSLMAHGWAPLPKRLLILLLFLPLFLLLNTLHFVGFAVDALLFRGWHKLALDRAIFIVGVPRSGTTFLQRTLALDQRFTTAATWEVILAPSISEKYLWYGLLSLIKPMGALVRRLMPGFFKQMDAVHELGLDEPEEDFLFLLALNACFILIALFPCDRRLWRLCDFDRQFSEREKGLIMRFYRACIQKHLYFRGRLAQAGEPELIYLSKNPSFSSFMNSLKEHFKEAKFVICLREPEVVLPSQLRSLQPAFKLVGNNHMPRGFVPACMGMMKTYYQSLKQAWQLSANSIPLVYNERLRFDLLPLMAELYAYFNLELSPKVAQEYEREAAKAKPGKKATEYGLEEFDLTEEQIKSNFKDVWPIDA